MTTRAAPPSASIPFVRTRLTWQAYLTIGIYSYMITALGPSMPFLRAGLNLSYTQASLHFSAYAVGAIITGLLLNRAAHRFGPHRLLWAGGAGMTAGALLLMFGPHPTVTILGAFIMGLMGVFLVALMNSALATWHVQHQAVAFTECAVISSLITVVAPVAVGFFARTALTWRAGLGLIVLVMPLLWLAFGRDPLPGMTAIPAQRSSVAARRTALPALYWLYLFGILLAAAIEYCITFWAADYLEKAGGLLKADAALAVSAFLVAEMLGRALNSRLLRRFAEIPLLLGSLLVASAGFLLFWLTPPPAAVVGLFVAGLGVAGLFPIINALALAIIPGRMVEGSGHISLAIGLAILLLPLLLGRLADWAGIRVGYSVEAVLLVLAILTISAARRRAQTPIEAG